VSEKDVTGFKDCFLEIEGIRSSQCNPPIRSSDSDHENGPAQFLDAPARVFLINCHQSKGPGGSLSKIEGAKDAKGELVISHHIAFHELCHDSHLTRKKNNIISNNKKMKAKR
jgi:hypothetical protein